LRPPSRVQVQGEPGGPGGCAAGADPAGKLAGARLSSWHRYWRTRSGDIPAPATDSPQRADGKDLNEIHIHDLLRTRTAAIPAATPVRDAAEAMLTGGYRQLPVTSDAGPIGIIDLTDLAEAANGPSPDAVSDQ
jgi:CBS domain